MNFPRHFSRVAAVVSILILPASCASIYDITTESLREQLSKVTPVTRTVKNDQGLIYAYSKERATNGLDSLICTKGKKMVPVTVHVSPNIVLEVRDTAKKSTPTEFYLDSVFCTDSTITGSTSQILKLKKSIRYGTIRNIRVNASHKGDLEYAK
ncbi:MAG: hypothetical protein LKK08_08415 [Bacteroidales bacterium]|jgi:hypothetical protein|nr:hypothetical protein [Bacteroidales bacterium]MCI2146242.1 hypothetical protein [Bacteroidales bacterium]